MNKNIYSTYFIAANSWSHYAIPTANLLTLGLCYFLFMAYTLIKEPCLLRPVICS